jgi:methylenetetrahydrofolate reductase (NADPH)
MNAERVALEEARRILDTPLYADLGGDAEVSFEFFPPKTEKMEEQLWESIETLAPLGPRFVSVTYGAGGSTRERTHNTVARIARETTLPAAAHLTCVAASKAEIAEVADAYWEAGVRHIVALRGDPPEQGARFEPHPEGYQSAAELVAASSAARFRDFGRRLSRNPPGGALGAEADLDNLKRKLDAGATRAITQFFFTPEAYFRFVDKARGGHRSAEILPGIMPSPTSRVKKMAAMCNTEVPSWMARLFEGLDEHPGARQLVAATVAAELCRKLYAGGVRSFHFYTLNRAELSYAICHLLGLRPQTQMS